MNRMIYIAPHTSQCHTVAPSSTWPGNTPTPATLADVPVGEIDGRAHGRPWPQMHNWIYVCSSSFLSALHGLGRPGPMDDKRGQQSQTPQLRALSRPSTMGRWDPSRGACARNCTESPDHRPIPNLNTVGPLHEHARRTRIALVETRRTHLR